MRSPLYVEVLIFNVLAILAILSWIFLPIFEIKSINYSQMIIPLGFQITLFGTKYLLISPLTIAALSFFIFSIVLPLVWRSSRYSLYASTISTFFGIAMIVNSFIFDQRYLHFYGYSVLPTPNGSFYILFPSTTIYNIPFYLVIVFSTLSLINSLTRARWLHHKRLTLLEKVERGQIVKASLEFVNSLGVYASSGEKYLKIDDLAIVEGKPGKEEEKNNISMFLPSGEQFFIGKNKVLHINDKGEIRYYNLEHGIKVILTKIIEKSNFNNEFNNKFFNNELYK